MPANVRKPFLDPVVLVTLGVLLLTVAFVLLVYQSQGEQGLAIRSASGSWSQILVAFVTGLTTGGLSCLAVQGGLLASSLAHQIEQDYLEDSLPVRKRHGRNLPAPKPNTAMPILLFLISKLAAYTLLGALLGIAGSYLALSPFTRAFLMIAIGIFMLGNALRMLNVHPLFRYFSIEPPKFITRYIRRTARNGTEIATPLFLGALTVFIPCGVTQAMMAAALATGSPVMGAALMFAFVLGTSPVFFLAAYLTTQLGARLERFFMRFVAVVLLVLGLVTLDGGLNLLGSPYSLTNMARALVPASVPSTPASVIQSGGVNQDLTLTVANNGYFPRTLRARAGQTVVLTLLTDRTYSCARDFVIPALNFYRLLPETGRVAVQIPAQQPGTRLFFTCSMGMYTGQILFEE